MSSPFQPKRTILGQDPAILGALWANVLSWLVRALMPSLLPRLLPAIEQEDVATPLTSTSVNDHASSSNSSKALKRTRCVVIGRPGGGEQLRLITLKPGIVSRGYNLGRGPFTEPLLLDGDAAPNIPPDCVVLNNQAFSVNYADCCIRWGLYESANKFCGYPICPGFDVAGEVECVGSQVRGLKPGDCVFGCSLFGAYSSRVLVPEMQLRKIPATANWTMAQAASLPTVALTSLYALFLAGHYPTRSEFHNKAVLIHSAAGGVGGMLVQMCKILGLSPIVGVVGRTAKVEAAKALGCDVVIDKQATPDLWAAAEAAAPTGYASIFDSSGVATLAQSYNHLAPTGRLIVFGFHTNLPVAQDSLSPWEWIKMAFRMQKMPKFDPMAMGSENKAVLAFNLSFFADEREMLSSLFSKVLEWISDGKLRCPRVVEMPMKDIQEAHALIQSGSTVGKIVLTT